MTGCRNQDHDISIWFCNECVLLTCDMRKINCVFSELKKKQVNIWLSWKLILWKDKLARLKNWQRREKIEWG